MRPVSSPGLRPPPRPPWPYRSSAGVSARSLPLPGLIGNHSRHPIESQGLAKAAGRQMGRVMGSNVPPKMPIRVDTRPLLGYGEGRSPTGAKRFHLASCPPTMWRARNNSRRSRRILESSRQCADHGDRRIRRSARRVTGHDAGTTGPRRRRSGTICHEEGEHAASSCRIAGPRGLIDPTRAAGGSLGTASFETS